MELLNCPFCNSDNLYIHRAEIIANTYWISCLNCGCYSKYSYSLEDCIKHWNTRVSYFNFLAEHVKKFPNLAKIWDDTLTSAYIDNTQSSNSIVHSFLTKIESIATDYYDF